MVFEVTSILPCGLLVFFYCGVELFKELFCYVKHPCHLLCVPFLLVTFFLLLKFDRKLKATQQD